MAQSDEASGDMAVLVYGELALVTYAGGLQFAYASRKSQTIREDGACEFFITSAT